MTPEQFKAKREALGLSQRDLAAIWGMGKCADKTIRTWESGDRPVNPIAAYCIRLMSGENV